MYRLVVHVSDDERETYEFLEDSRESARLRAEEVSQQGFWLDGSKPLRFIPPSRIRLVQIKRYDDPVDDSTESGTSDNAAR